jgi:two-component system catabolic regulation response regulator CreB/two-component system response regulator ChvI
MLQIKYDDNNLNAEKIENSPKKRILIVDDEADITLSFSLALEDSGLFEVDAYNDPLVALSNYRPNSYDLLLLDIKMPEMNGFELYDHIKKLDHKVKVCFISAHGVDLTALREQFPSLERDGLATKNIMRKPIEVSRLIERIELEILT